MTPIHFLTITMSSKPSDMPGFGSYRHIISKLVAVGNADKISVCFDYPVVQFLFLEWIRFDLKISLLKSVDKFANPWFSVEKQILCATSASNRYHKAHRKIFHLHGNASTGYAFPLK
jgi:hypothetical protein